MPLRRLQFRLRTIFIATALVALMCFAGQWSWRRWLRVVTLPSGTVVSHGDPTTRSQRLLQEPRPRQEIE
jgi:hypothetical protein